MSASRKATKPDSVKGKIYRIIMGKLKGEDTLTEQAYRYPIKDWTEAQARAHAEAHGISNFEPATGESKAEDYVEMEDGSKQPVGEHVEEEKSVATTKYDGMTIAQLRAEIGSFDAIDEDDGKVLLERYNQRVRETKDAEPTPPAQEGAEAEVNHVFRVMKLNPKQHKVMGVVYAPETPDSWDEYMTAEEIEKAADFFMENHQGIDEMHDMVAGVGYPTQSFIARAKDPDGFPEGAWVLEVKVTNDSVWKKLLSGEYKAYSFSGSARHGKEKDLDSMWVNDKGERVSPYGEAQSG